MIVVEPSKIGSIWDLQGQKVRFCIGSHSLMGTILEFTYTGILYKIVDILSLGSDKHYSVGDVVFLSHGGGNVLTVRDGQFLPFLTH